ncbi:hypothetical protein H6800_03210 [Candidatus Nomurabacteria bacterium]|nr:hypothetical protein [Candidatus Nomurabacteria bacterium]
MFSPDLEEVRLKYFSHRDRTADSQAIARIVGGGIGSTDQTFESPFDSQNPIHQIGKQQYTEFRAAAQEANEMDLPWSEVEHGFIAISSGIIKCIHAYIRYCEAISEAHYDKSQLKAALINPRTISFFLKISSISEVENREYEAFFNLRTPYNDGDHGEFVFNPDSNSFDSDPTLESVAEEEAANAKHELIKLGIDKSEFGNCPATKFIPTFWKNTVEVCDNYGLLDEPVHVDKTCERPSDRTY